MHGGNVSVKSEGLGCGSHAAKLLHCKGVDPKGELRLRLGLINRCVRSRVDDQFGAKLLDARSHRFSVAYVKTGVR